MNFARYHKEKQDTDGEPLWWPGGPDGFPFRGSRPPTVTDTEYQDLVSAAKVRQKLFYLNKEEDAKDYIIVREKCANGLFIPIDRDRVWDEETNNYRVYLEWAEPAYEAPTSGVKDAIKEYAQQDGAVTIPVNRLAGLQAKGW